MERKCVEVEKLLRALFLVVVITFLFLSVTYVDNFDNAQTGYMILNYIMNGKWNHVFQNFNWSYGFSIYFIYAIWSIPVWIVFQKNGFTLPIRDFMGATLWYKALIVLFAIWSIYLVCRIAERIAGAKKVDVALQYMSSALFVFVIFAIVQCDIMGLCFVLLGINYYMQDKYVKFLLSFAIAITMKYFALFAFIPLIIYKERRILKILITFIGGLSFTILTNYILSFSKGAQEAGASEEFYVNKRMEAFDAFALNVGADVEIGLLAAVFLGVCLLAYCIDNRDIELRNKRILWLCLAGYMCFGMFYPYHFYWNILTVPFFILIMYCNKGKLKVNILLEIIFYTSLLLLHTYKQSHVFMGYNAFNYLIFQGHTKFNNENLIAYFLENILHFELKDYLSHLYGLQYASGLIFMYVNFPRANAEVEETEDTDKLDIKILQWVKIAVLYIFTAMAFCGWYYGCQESLYDGRARVTFVTGGYEKNGCTVSGELEYLGEDIWLGEELEVTIYVSDFEKDIRMSTYGYTVDGRTNVEIYVDEQYVGILQMDDPNANTAERYLVLQKELFTENGLHTIKLKAEPKPIKYHDKEYMISLYMKYIDLTACEE